MWYWPSIGPAAPARRGPVSQALSRIGVGCGVCSPHSPGGLGTFDIRRNLLQDGGMFAVLSVWIALGALVTSVIVIFRPDHGADLVVTLLQYTIALSATLAAGVLWWLRTRPADEPGVAGQRLQALASLLINSLTFAILLFSLLEPVYALTAMVIEYVFLYITWLLYTRIVMRKA